MSAERDVELARIALIQTLQLDPRGNYDFVAPKVGDVSGTVPKYDLDSLLSRAFASRSDLAAEQTRVQVAAVGTKAAAATRLEAKSGIRIGLEVHVDLDGNRNRMKNREAQFDGADHQDTCQQGNENPEQPLSSGRKRGLAIGHWGHSSTGKNTRLKKMPDFEAAVANP